jgi:hypothetical protein
MLQERKGIDDRGITKHNWFSGSNNNQEWFLQRHQYKTPMQVRQEKFEKRAALKPTLLAHELEVQNPNHHL